MFNIISNIKSPFLLSFLCFFALLERSSLGQENFGKVEIYPNIGSSVLGNVTIDGEAAGEGDVVAIYVGEELRGKKEVIVNGGIAWLNAQVSAAGGDETAKFKVYDKSSGVTHDNTNLVS